MRPDLATLPALASSAPASPPLLARIAAPALKYAAGSWYAVAVAGHLMFATYVVGFYLRAAVEGRFDDWNKQLPHGYVPGDTFGNLVVLSHLVFTVVIMLSGAVQLVPALRRAVPAFHRWNGRLFLTSAMIMSLGGLTMIATRGMVVPGPQSAAIIVNAILIIAFAALAFRYARARRFDVHRKWALRLFLVVSGVFFLRVGLMFYALIAQGAPSGTLFTLLAYAQFVLPLIALELYFRGQERGGPALRLVAASVIGLLTLVTATGIAGATFAMWLPRM